MKINIEPIDNTENIAVAVSGGIDSMVLANILSKQHSKQHIFAITIDHNLRAESKYEANFVTQELQKININHQILSWDHDNIKSNIQHKARNARYEIITNWCNKHNIKYLFTAHHKNDQAETIIMRIMRGIGIDGLEGIKKKFIFNNVSIIRPMLQYTRYDVYNYAINNNIKWVEDKSNKDQKYTRIQIRNALAKYQNKTLTINRIYLLSQHAFRVNNAIQFYAKQAIKKYVQQKENSSIIQIAIFKNEPEEIYMQILTKELQRIGGKQYKPRYKSFINLLQSITKNTIHKNRTLANCKISTAENSIIINKEKL